MPRSTSPAGFPSSPRPSRHGRQPLTLRRPLFSVPVVSLPRPARPPPPPYLLRSVGAHGWKCAGDQSQTQEAAGLIYSSRVLITPDERRGRRQWEVHITGTSRYKAAPPPFLAGFYRRRRVNTQQRTPAQMMKTSTRNASQWRSGASEEVPFCTYTRV